MKQKTPQEKKALSYAKDRRNTYMENDKSSRKKIPLRKARQNRVFRKATSQILQKVVEINVQNLEVLESEVLSVKKGTWKKFPDTPLGEVVERQIDWREKHAGKGKTAFKKIREIIENLDIEIAQEDDNRWVAKAKKLSNIKAVGESSESAVERLKHLIEATLKNEMGFDVWILIDGKVIKPTYKTRIGII